MSHRSPETEMNANVRRLGRQLGAVPGAVPVSKPPRLLALSIDLFAVLGLAGSAYLVGHWLWRLAHG